MTNVSFISSGSLTWWADSWVGYMDESLHERNLPIVLKDSLYHYFGFDGTHYNLLMTSTINLKEKKI